MKATLILSILVVLQAVTVFFTDAHNEVIRLHNKLGDKQLSLKETCLYAHNKVRALHKKTPSLNWDEDLSSKAKIKAQRLANQKRLNKDLDGTNFFFKASNTANVVFTPANAVWAWYQESVDSNYDYSKPGSEQKSNTRNFTQVVWEKSARVGCGVATIKNGLQYETHIVALYRPKGNVEGKYQKNVHHMKPGAKTPASILDLEKQGPCIDKTDQCTAKKDLCSNAYFSEILCAATCRC